MIERISKTVDTLINELCAICETNGVTFFSERKNDMLTQIRLNESVIIRVYNTKKGLKIDDSIASNKEITNKILNKWKELHYTEEENKSYPYEGIKNYDEIKSQVLSLSDDGLNIKENAVKGNGLVSSIVILQEDTHEKITLNFYNSNTLVVQGFTGHLWARVCRIIETVENYNVDEILKRMSNESLSLEVTSKKEDYTIYKDALKQALTQPVYDFLSNEDMDYLVSAQLLIDKKVSFPRYNAILCPACLTLEGFLKKLLVNLKIVRHYQVANSKFNFGQVFDEFHKLPREKCNVMNLSTDEQKKKAKSALENIYLKINAFRNPACHSGGGMSSNINKVTTFEKCKNIYEKDILEFIKNSYYQVYN